MYIYLLRKIHKAQKKQLEDPVTLFLTFEFKNQ